jgi:hypothetical protein
MKSCRTLMMLAGPLLALGATRALAQTSQMPMPMGGQMTWGMIAVCALGVIVLILAAVALVKYIFFR